MKQLDLSSNWQCKRRDTSIPVVEDRNQPEGWIHATVPGTVYLDLLREGIIPDPFVGLNEHQVQWVGESDWLYRCDFEVPADFLQMPHLVLSCEGLDTFATIWLNGKKVLVNDNMFVPRRIDVTSQLHAGTNKLSILFESALRRGREIESEYGVLNLWNGDSSRLYVRKAAYQYGWDWGPTLLDAGPWRPLRLEAYEARISNLHCPIEITADLQQATITTAVGVEVRGSIQPEDFTLHLKLTGPDGVTIEEKSIVLEGVESVHSFTLNAPQLWWPHGYGAQPLYTLTTRLLYKNVEIEQKQKRLGIRRLRLVQDPLEDAPGTSFYFEINNTPIFCGGANWIPADSLLNRITAARYREWLQLAVDAHMVMLRVWGGGLYEDDAFYDACDELGLLVWQDFMFACGIYPALDWFQESIRAEAEAALRRLRHHPSIVLWAGNNEDYAIAQSLHRYNASFTGDFTQTRFPARIIYERLLPEICERLDPERSYWPGSPYGGDDPNDLTVGDQHIWSIWHGLDPYQDYPKYAGRFVSEFGMQAFPALETIVGFAPPEELYPQSRTIEHHNRADKRAARLAAYVSENIRFPADLEGYIYASQFIQAEALGAGIRGWRRRWKGRGRAYTAGALIWQLNDCWPVTSWAIVDYYLRPKPAYYLVRRELAPFVVGLNRSSAHHVSAWAVNGNVEEMTDLTLVLRTWSFEGQLLAEERREVILPANQTSELGDFAVQLDNPAVVAATLLQGDEVLARTVLWPEPFKYFNLPQAQVAIERLDAETVSVSTNLPAKGVWLSTSQPVVWSDNMLDLVPGEAQIIKVQRLDDQEIQVRYLSN